MEADLVCLCGARLSRGERHRAWCGRPRAKDPRCAAAGPAPPAAGEGRLFGIPEEDLVPP